MRLLRFLAGVLTPLAAIASNPAPADVPAINQALWMASRCTTRPAADPSEACRRLIEASRERVVIHPHAPGATTSEVTLQRTDGTLQHVEFSVDHNIHGMVWVEPAGLYVGYADNCGEVGFVIVFHPNSDQIVRMPGPPVLTPDGTHVVSADVDYGGDKVELELFALESQGLRSVLRQDQPAQMPGRVDAVGFIGATAVVGVDLQDDPSVRTFDLSTHLESEAPAQQDVDSCVKSERARYLTGDQVFLRQIPSTSGQVEAALPWGTCVQARGTFADWELVEVAGQYGFVSRRFVSTTPPARSALAEDLRGFCTSLNPMPDWMDYGLGSLLRANRHAGVPGYYTRPMLDDFCLGLRPAEVPGIDLGAFERSDAESLDVRFATWTLALAPESAYRARSSVRLLNDSPLFRAVPATRSASVGSVNVGFQDESFHAYFGAEPPGVEPAPDSLHLLSVVPDARGLLIHGSQAFHTLGPDGSSFPAGHFRLSDDMSEVRFDRPLSGLVLDPCAGAFLPVTLNVSYTPGTGRFGARIDEATRARLHACNEGLSLEEYGATRFVVVIDEGADSSLLPMLTTDPQSTRALESSALLIPWAREWRWTEGESLATLRTLTWAECGAMNVTELEVRSAQRQYRLQTGVYDTRDCGL